MQAQLLCATCTTPLALKVPELTGARWHTRCAACGQATELEANLSRPEELATFNSVGVYAA